MKPQGASGSGWHGRQSPPPRVLRKINPGHQYSSRIRSGGSARAEAVRCEEGVAFSPLCPASTVSEMSLLPRAPGYVLVLPPHLLMCSLALCDFIWLLLAQAGCWGGSQMWGRGST